MLLGVALIPLPGPFSIPLMIAGLAVLATEYVWAEKVLDTVKEKAKRASDAARRSIFRRQAGIAPTRIGHLTCRNWADQLSPDVALMDVRMPHVDGIDATRAVTATDSPPKVLVLTTFDLDDVVYEALRAGASGFLLKDAPEERLITAIRVVADKEDRCSPRPSPER